MAHPTINPKNHPFQYLLAALFYTAACYFLFTSLYTLYHSGITTLFADQWRTYTTYFNKPFPENIFSSQNSHRLIVSGGLFFIDIYFFNATQRFLLLLGALLALATAGILSWCVLKDKAMSIHRKAAAVYITFALSFWLALGRELLHGNESVHAYLVTFFLMIALLALTKYRNSPSPPPRKAWPWAILDCACSLLATLSFGAGAALPPTLLVLAIMLRMPKGQTTLFFINFIIVMLIYLLDMPHSSGVNITALTTGPIITSLTNIF